MLPIRTRIAFALLAASVVSGCAGSSIRADETPRTPPLVRVSEQVWVVAERERPIFFCSGSYWLYARDGAWFQSNDFDGEFVAVASYSVPQPLLDVPDPGRFVFAVGSVVNGEQGYVSSQVGISPPTPESPYVTATP